MRSKWVIAFKCKKCGAFLDPSIDDLVYICPYCGYPNPVIGRINTEHIYIVPSKYDLDSIRHDFINALKKIRSLKKIVHRLHIRRILGYYLPLWFIDVEYYGRITFIKYSLRGRQIVEKDVSDKLSTYIVGHQFFTEKGVDQLFNHYLKTKPSTYRLSEKNISEWFREGMRILSIDVDREHLYALLKHPIVSRVVKKRYVKPGYEVKYIDVDIDIVSEPYIVYLPVWIIYFEYNRASYYAVVSGWDGEIIYYTRPTTTIDIVVDSAKIFAMVFLIVSYIFLIYTMPYIVFKVMEQSLITTILLLGITGIMVSIFMYYRFPHSEFIFKVIGEETAALAQYVMVIPKYGEIRASYVLVVAIVMSSIVLAQVILLLATLILYTLFTILYWLTPILLSLWLFLLTMSLFMYLVFKLIDLGSKAFRPTRIVKR